MNQDDIVTALGLQNAMGFDGGPTDTDGIFTTSAPDRFGTNLGPDGIADTGDENVFSGLGFDIIPPLEIQSASQEFRNVGIPYQKFPQNPGG